MRRTEKQIQALLLADAELRDMLLPILRSVAEGRGTAFFVTEQNNPWSKRSWSKEGSDILAQAQAVLRLAEQIGEDTASLVAQRVVETFNGANDLTEHQRLGPIRLAQQLLKDLGE